MSSEAYRKNFAEIDWSIPREPLPKAQGRTGRAFYIVKDIDPYRSPINGEVISSRSKHRDHMREQGVIEVGTEKPTPHKRKPMPDLRHDIKEAIEKLQGGYRPHHETHRE